MSTAGSGEVHIYPTFENFRSSVTTQVDGAAKDSGSRFASIFGNAVKGIGAGIAVGVTAAIAGAGAIASKGLDRALNIQDAKAQLTGLGHSAESVSTIMESALASVKGTAFGLDQSAKIAASSVAAGIAPGEALTRVLKLTADSATIAKVPLSEMGSIINKVATNQKLTTETMQQFQDRGIPILQAVASQYGVTADEAAGMVSRGEVDFETFQRALESSVGGAALASGQTARGAFANIGAAFGRMGAMFVQPAVDGAPGLFQSIAGAVDRASAVMAPYAAKFSELLTPAIANLSAWIDRVDFGALAERIRNLFSVVKEAVATGDYSSFGDTFGKISAVISPLAPLFIQLAQGIGGIAGSIGKVIAAGFPLLVPILEGFANALTFLGDNPQLLAAALIAIAGAFLLSRIALVANNAAMAVSIPLRYAELATTIARTSALRANTAALLGQTAAERVGLGARVAGVAASVAATAATVATRVAMVAGAVATGVATAAQWAFNAALTANPIGLIIAAIVALVAGLIWFFTQTELGQTIWAEFTRFLGEAWANIVSFVTTAIGVIVDVITNVVGFIVGVWNAFWTGLSAVVGFVWALIVFVVTTYINIVVAVITAIVGFIVDVWTNFWNGLVFVVGLVWGLIVAYVTFYIQTVLAVVTAVVNFIVAVWTASWNFISDVISNVWNFIVGFVTAYINVVLAVISAVVSTISAVWNGAWSAISGFFEGIWNGIRGFVIQAVATILSAIFGFVSSVQSTVQGVFDTIGSIPDTILGLLGDLGTLLIDSGAALIQGFIDGITGMVDAVGDAVGGVMDFVAGFFPNSPAKRGPFSGSGWVKVRSGGSALVDQFRDGMGDDPFGFDGGVDGGDGPGSPGSGSGDTYVFNGQFAMTADEIEEVTAKKKRRRVRRSGFATAAGVS